VGCEDLGREHQAVEQKIIRSVELKHQIRPLGLPGDAKVTQDRSAITSNEDVVRFAVEMHDIVRLQKVCCFQQIRREPMHEPVRHGHRQRLGHLEKIARMEIQKEELSRGDITGVYKRPILRSASQSQSPSDLLLLRTSISAHQLQHRPALDASCSITGFQATQQTRVAHLLLHIKRKMVGDLLWNGGDKLRLEPNHAAVPRQDLQNLPLVVKHGTSILCPEMRNHLRSTGRPFAQNWFGAGCPNCCCTICHRPDALEPVCS
jgi:hypothetical protein